MGVGLTRVDRLDEAEKALNNAHSLNPKSEWLWRNLADLCLKQKNLEKEIDALETLYAFGKAEYADLNQLGSAYYKHQSFAKALKYLRLSAATVSSPVKETLLKENF